MSTETTTNETDMVKRWEEAGHPVTKFKMRAEYFRDLTTFFEKVFTAFNDATGNDFFYLPYVQIDSGEYGATCVFYTSWTWEMLFGFIENKVVDGHVMAETLAPYSEYTDERRVYLSKKRGTSIIPASLTNPTEDVRDEFNETIGEIFPEFNRTEATTETTETI